VQAEVARRVRYGHPWVYREALGKRVLSEAPGDVIELVDPDGEFVARGIVDGHSPIAVRIVSRARRERIDADAMAARVRSAVQLRKSQGLWDEHTCLRLVNAESDEVPAVSVDRYGEFALVQLYSPAMDPHLDAICDGLKPESFTGIYLQRRYRSLSGDAPPGGAELIRGKAAPVELEVREKDLRFYCDVTAPLSTGLFGDLRSGREVIARRSAGKKVLNLFSYTGAISVYALSGGATEITAVDVAAKAHARARRNLALNGFDAEKPEHIAGDAFKALARFAERGRRFDLIVMDPPAFASGSKGARPWSAVKNYGELVEASLGVLEPGGLLVCVSSTHKFSLYDFEQALAVGGLRAGFKLSIIERCGLPPDYPSTPGFNEANYLKFAVCAATAVRNT